MAEGVKMRGKATVLVNPTPGDMPTLADLREGATDWGLREKVVVVTGASRGIGETTAKLMAIHGAKVIVNYRTGADDARRIVAEIAHAGGFALAVGADITKPDEVRTLFERSVEEFGPVDVLVNNAARDFRPVPFEMLTWDEIQRDLDVAVKGAFLCCQQVIPGMLEQGGGAIVNISSVAVDDPPPGQAKYVIAKAALLGLTRSVAVAQHSR
jgi:NAD(P)-dependent dehydrogenase (short-subunit alcohol dehydrogenase family)